MARTRATKQTKAVRDSIRRYLERPEHVGVTEYRNMDLIRAVISHELVQPLLTMRSIPECWLGCGRRAPIDHDSSNVRALTPCRYEEHYYNVLLGMSNVRGTGIKSVLNGR